MDLQKELDESGYTEDLEKLEAAKAFLKLARETPPGDKRPDLLPQLERDLVEMAAEIERIEAKLAKRYEAAVKYVDAMNDMELVSEDILERGELVAEYFEDELGRPDAAEWIRKLMAGDDPGPPPTP